MRKTRNTPQERKNPSPPTATPQDPGSCEAPFLEESAPATTSRHLLNPSHARFCEAYLHDLNATQAYMRAYPHASRETAGQQGYQLLKNPQIRDEIQRLMDERAAITGITAARVLLRLWDMATADPRQLVEVIVGACRHCWGEYHQYQYTDAEWERVHTEHVRKQAKRRKEHLAKGLPEDKFEEERLLPRGGTGYTPNRKAHPDCPECWGRGMPQTVIKDTRDVSPGALMLFAGVKDTEHGKQVLLHPALPALLKVGEHLGMWSDKLPGPKEANPLEVLLQQIHGMHGAGSALPVVHDDPERRTPRPAQDVQDVTAKPEPGSSASSRKTWRPLT